MTDLERASIDAGLSSYLRDRERPDLAGFFIGSRPARRVWYGRHTLTVYAIAILAAVAALAFFAGRASAATGLDAPVAAKVIRCHDGDTCRFAIYNADGSARAFTGRIVGVDTPEIPPKPEECGGQGAASAAQRLLYPGRPVWLQHDLAAGLHDRYGRELVVPRFYRGSKPGRTYERRMLLDGWANVYDFRHERLALLGLWVAQRNLAMAADTNAWSCPGPTGTGPSTSIYAAWSTGPAPTPLLAVASTLASRMTDDHRAGCMVYQPAIIWGVRIPGAPCGSLWFAERQGRSVIVAVVDNASLDHVVDGQVALGGPVADYLRCRVDCRIAIRPAP